MKFRLLISVFLIVLSLFPAYLGYLKLQKLMRPKESVTRFLLFMIIIFMLIFIYSFLLVFIAGWLFPASTK